MPIYSNPTQLASLQAGKKKKGRGAGAVNEENDKLRRETEDFVGRIRLDIDASYRLTEPWRTAALESYGFVENDKETIWGKKDLDYMMKLPVPPPMFVLNDIIPVIRILSGIERQKQESLLIKPRTGSDVDSALIMTELVQYVDDENLGFYQRIRKSNDVNITGRGYIKTDISYDENVNGDIIVKRRNPLSVFNDPMADEWDGTDRRWTAEGEWLTEEEAKELWPDFKDQIKIGDWLSGKNTLMSGEMTGDRNANEKLFLDAATKRVRIFDYWYKKLEIVNLAVNMDTGDVQPIYDQDEFMKRFREMDGEQQAAVRFTRRKQQTVRICTIMNWLMMQDALSPYSHSYFPITPYVGLQFYGEPHGPVEYLKDPQRLHNKSISQAMNHLNRTAHSGWVNSSVDGVNPDYLDKFGSTPGINFHHGGTPPVKIEQSPLSQGHLTLMSIGKDQIKSTSMVNAEIQGLEKGSRAVSGIAIERRQKGGLVGNEDLFDNGLLGDKIVGNQIISHVQQIYTPSRCEQIVNNLGLGATTTPLAQLMQRRHAEMTDLIMTKVLKEEYHYVIDRTGGGLSSREQLSEKMIALADKWASHGPVPIELIIATLNTLDIPSGDKEAIKQGAMRLNQIMLGGAAAQAMPPEAAGLPPGIGGANGAGGGLPV